MILLRDSTPIPAEASGAVVALGNFDGLHLGHRAVIEKAVALAHAARRPAMVMTFEPHPRRVFKPSLPPLRLMPLQEKLQLLEAVGVGFVRIVRFSRAFSETAPEDFVTRYLHEALCVSQVVTGEDFVFGHNRGGNVAMLKAMADTLGFAAATCPPVEVEGGRCSSTRIREALSEGDVALAGTLLGRPYRVTSRVRAGDQRGRVLGFPTANLLPPPVFLPALGIYAVKARVCGRHAKGVASLGIRPDFPLKHPLLEVHLFDWHEEIYGERMEVEFVHYLRPEQKYGNVEQLKAQITEDCSKAKSLL
jgi:riboflavin kinase/FMN adenylyltransferase